MSDTVSATTAIELKGGMITLTRIKILQDDLQEIQKELKDKIKQAPNFFYKAPVVLDCKDLTNPVIDFGKLYTIISKLNLVPIGITNSNKELMPIAAAAGFAILRTMSDKQGTKPQDSAPAKQNNAAKEPTQNRLINENVRSGQQIYAPYGDIIVRGSVSNGAELIARGNIHIYGALRGRALAGVDGDVTARIFCSCLEAELVSIAGQYMISEDMEHSLWQRPAEVLLQDNNLKMNPL